MIKLFSGLKPFGGRSSLDQLVVLLSSKNVSLDPKGLVQQFRVPVWN